METIKKYKAGVCGHFGKDKQFLDGQTVKTKILTEALKNRLGADSVKTIDTYGWKTNPISLFIKCLFLMKNCENIIILPAHMGVKVFVPLFALLNILFHRKLHYIVIGGWLPKLLIKNNILKYGLSKFDGIYVETNVMVESLRGQGLKNIRYLQNFKPLKILNEKEMIYHTGEPFKLCTFSRVMKEKGIEDAIEVIKRINSTLGKVIYTLDIYGQIDKDYIERFKELRREFPSYITYKGSVEFNDTVKVLKDYFVLLFPTHFMTEGMPGAIVDAYAAGVPVLASKWEAATEIIDEGITGIIYDHLQDSKLEEILFQLIKEPLRINKMKKNCLEKAKLYSSDSVINEIIKFFNRESKYEI